MIYSYFSNIFGNWESVIIDEKLLGKFTGEIFNIHYYFAPKPNWYQQNARSVLENDKFCIQCEKLLRAALPKYRLNQEIAKKWISSNSPRMKFFRALVTKIIG